MMEVRNSQFAAFIDQFTSNTYICLVMSSDPNVSAKIVDINLRNSRVVFEELEKKSNNPQQYQQQHPAIE